MTARERRRAGAALGHFIFAVVILLGLAAVLLLAMAAGRAADAARAAVTPAEVAACMGDAQRFCLQHVGSREAMQACMIAHKAQLSEACREVLR